MKLKYDMNRGQRLKRKWFGGVTCAGPSATSLWWFYDRKVWAPVDDYPGEACSNYSDVRIRSVRAFRRYLRKLAGHVPAGTPFTLSSRFVGHSIHGRVPKK